VKWFNENKGYGFIVGDSGKDIFVHYSEIRDDGYRTLAEGEVVEYELMDSPKGPQAKSVLRSVKRGAAQQATAEAA
jgi:CspA family cold shock protein